MIFIVVISMAIPALAAAAFSLEPFPEDIEKTNFIICDEDGRVFQVHAILLPGVWERQRKACVAVGFAHVERSAMLFSDLLRQTEAQAGALADRLGGEKRFHNPDFHLRWHAMSAIYNGKNHTVLLRKDLQVNPPFSALFLCRVESILQEIDEQLRNLHFSASNA
jgi:hypothetical protein